MTVLQGGAQGSACFLAGFLMVVWGWAVVGSLVEAYGFFLLFAGFFPTVLGFLRSVPYLGRVLDAPSLKRVRHPRPCTPGCSVLRNLTTYRLRAIPSVCARSTRITHTHNMSRGRLEVPAVAHVSGRHQSAWTHFGNSYLSCV